MQDGQKMLMILRMFPIDNINEVTTHMLEAINVRLEAEALSKGSSFSSKIMNNPGAELANSMSFMSGDNDMSAARQMGLTPLQEKIYRIIQPMSNTTAGISRQAVMQHFSVNQQREVNAALEFLISEGHAYSTIDNDHFKVTDSM